MFANITESKQIANFRQKLKQLFSCYCSLFNA